MKPQSAPALSIRGRIDDRGRVTIPKEIRDLAGLNPGLLIHMRTRRDGSVAIELVDVSRKL